MSEETDRLRQVAERMASTATYAAQAPRTTVGLSPETVSAIADLLDGLAGGIDAMEFEGTPYPETAGMVRWPLAIADAFLAAALAHPSTDPDG